MNIILSPAKKMRVDTDSLAPRDLPPFLPQTQRLMEAMRAMSEGELKTLWRCNDTIAKHNVERLGAMDLRRNLTPAILSYEGIAYQYMAPGVFEQFQFDYIQEHLRILSGFYGLLRPFDGVTPYRLEMGARLAVDGHRDLYAFWGERLAKELAGETDLVLNLASQEYARAVEPHLPPTVTFLTCTFGALQGGKVIEKGTLCKMARGQMVRWLAEEKVTRREDVCQFEGLGYRVSRAHSTDTNYVFLKEGGYRHEKGENHRAEDHV